MARSMYPHDYRPSTRFGVLSASTPLSTMSVSNGLSNGNRLIEVESKTTGSYSTAGQNRHDAAGLRHVPCEHPSVEKPTRRIDNPTDHAATAVPDTTYGRGNLLDFSSESR